MCLMYFKCVLLGNTLTLFKQISILSDMSIHLELPHNRGVILLFLTLPSLQLEGVAEVCQPLELGDVLQLALVYLRQDAHTQTCTHMNVCKLHRYF